MKYSKTNAALLSLLLVLIVAYPVIENWRPEPKDSFPMSYYPMFSLKRSKNYTLRHFVGYDQEENRHKIHYKYIGSGGLNQVRHQVNKMCREGNKEKLMDRVLKNIERRSSSKFKNIKRIELVKATYDLEDYFIRDVFLPKKERVLEKANIKSSWFGRLNHSSEGNYLKSN